MLTESFVAATLTANKPLAHASAALKDVGIFVQEFQPESTFRHGYKKSSTQPGCVAISESHIFAAQSEKAVVNVYSRAKGNQEATVPFPERIHSVAYAHGPEVLILGTEGGKLILWEVATGRVTNSTAAHLQAVSCLCITPKNEYIISGSADSSIHVWSLAKLVSFVQPSSGFDNDELSNAPVNTFSGHRSEISAIGCGHSHFSTNFAVSASDDGTCHVWHTMSCELLRTVLLPNSATSIVLDPADRAVYFGCKDGHIQSWDIFQQSAQPGLPPSSNSNLPPIQLLAKDRWAIPSTDTGPANCLTISYDGMSLLSGHAHGTVIRWDVAKHRIMNEVTNFGQPVTNIEMLKPVGFPNQKKSNYTVSQVVKPNLEFASMNDNGSCGISAKYNLNVVITAPKAVPEHTDFEHAITNLGIPQSMLDAAIGSLDTESMSQGQSAADSTGIAKAERLEDEITKLKQQVSTLQEVEEKSRARKLARMAERDALGLKKREAYFEAKKQGKDGDVAMKKWEVKEAELDRASDEDIGTGDEMDIG